MSAVEYLLLGVMSVRIGEALVLGLLVFVAVKLARRR